MSTDNLGSGICDYFEPPACSDSVADIAYHNFVSQDVETSVAFGPWLESRAWMAAFHLLDPTPSAS